MLTYELPNTKRCESKEKMALLSATQKAIMFVCHEGVSDLQGWVFFSPCVRSRITFMSYIAFSACKARSFLSYILLSCVRRTRRHRRAKHVITRGHGNRLDGKLPSVDREQNGGLLCAQITWKS